jgi:hypothetical protein
VDVFLALAARIAAAATLCIVAALAKMDTAHGLSLRSASSQR